MNQLRIVLVKTKYPRNIGLVSRAMSNFGVDRLILINPQCSLSLKARQGAAEGQGPLSQSVTYTDWDEFYKNEPEGLRVAMSRRQGRRRKSQPFDQLILDKQLPFHQPTYLIFGSEDKGLAGEDLSLVHHLTSLELPGMVQSMNLSHAVVASLQIFYSHFKELKIDPNPPLHSVKDPEPFLRQWLEALNFDLNTHTRWNALVMLQQLILRSSPSPDEMHKLEMIIQQTSRRLK